MKKILALILVFSLCLGLVACGQPATNNPSNSPTDSTANGDEKSQNRDKFKIAILEVQLNDESTNRANYFNDYIAPRYNCEFMFSEACQTIDAAMTFIENAADAGCDAVINYFAVPANTEHLVQLCRERDMIFVENGGRFEVNDKAFTSGYENFAGGFMADQPATGKLFYDYLKETMTADAGHGFIVATGAAYQGNPQQFEISLGMMNAISDVYGLTFDSPVEELITSSSPVQATNNLGIEIYCYPGAAQQAGWLEGLSAALQTGKYDYAMFAANSIGSIGTAINEVEVALNKDITVIGFGTFGDALKNALNTMDKFGNPSLSMSTVKFTSIVSAMGFSKVYNLLTGYKDCINGADGAPTVDLFNMQAVTSAEQLANMETWDQPGKWVADYDFVDSLLGEYSSGLTAEQVQKNIYGMTYEVIADRLK